MPVGALERTNSRSDAACGWLGIVNSCSVFMVSIIERRWVLISVYVGTSRSDVPAFTLPALLADTKAWARIGGVGQNPAGQTHEFRGNTPEIKKFTGNLLIFWGGKCAYRDVDLRSNFGCELANLAVGYHRSAHVHRPPRHPP
jgi:hypothetical protein